MAISRKRRIYRYKIRRILMLKINTLIKKIYIAGATMSKKISKIFEFLILLQYHFFSKTVT